MDLYSWMFHAKSFKTSCMKIQFVLLNNIVTVNEKNSAERKKTHGILFTWRAYIELKLVCPLTVGMSYAI